MRTCAGAIIPFVAQRLASRVQLVSHGVGWIDHATRAEYGPLVQRVGRRFREHPSVFAVCVGGVDGCEGGVVGAPFAEGRGVVCC